jgi:hypothetical protein
MRALRTALAAAAFGALTCMAAGAGPSTVQVKLYAQNRPGETGTATFRQVPDGVKVVVTMGGGQNGTQPVRIHTGTCAKRNPVPTYTLTNIVDGISTTTIPGIKLGDLLKGNYVIDIHDSSADETKYVACAAIVAPN